jgi:hypothetical protein
MLDNLVLKLLSYYLFSLKVEYLISFKKYTQIIRLVFIESLEW